VGVDGFGNPRVVGALRGESPLTMAIRGEFRRHIGRAFSSFCAKAIVVAPQAFSIAT
jgi:hypothetical protein